MEGKWKLYPVWFSKVTLNTLLAQCLDQDLGLKARRSELNLGKDENPQSRLKKHLQALLFSVILTKHSIITNLILITVHNTRVALGLDTHPLYNDSATLTAVNTKNVTIM